jgi:hypothetical protein
MKGEEARPVDRRQMLVEPDIGVRRGCCPIGVHLAVLGLEFGFGGVIARARVLLADKV